MLPVVYSALLTHERTLWNEGSLFVAGVDEVGCGAWAGDVFAAAVILSPTKTPPRAQDSKRLSSLARTRLAEDVRKKSIAWAIGRASLEEIDQLNIRGAAFLAMRRALASLSITPTTVLCDGFMIPEIIIPCIRLVGGDHLSRSIAAASILAKVARDEELSLLSKEYPLYHFEQHKGYGTKVHAEALKEHGPCPLHRKSFAPIAAALLSQVSNSKL